MAIKDLCFKHVDIWIILEFIWNNFDTFRALIQDNTTHFFSEFILNNIETFRETLPHKTPVRVHVNQNWHFWRAAIKQHDTHFSEFISHKTFPESYYKMKLHIFSEFLSNNIYTYRVTTKQYCKIILFYTFLSKKLIFSESYYQIYYRLFPQKMYQTTILFLLNVNLFQIFIDCTGIGAKSTFRKIFKKF